MFVLNSHNMTFGFHSECDGKPLTYLTRKGKVDTARLMYQFLKVSIQITTNLVPRNNRNLFQRPKSQNRGVGIYNMTCSCSCPGGSCHYMVYGHITSNFYHCLHIAFSCVCVFSTSVSLEHLSLGVGLIKRQSRKMMRMTCSWSQSDTKKWLDCVGVTSQQEKVHLFSLSTIFLGYLPCSKHC